jgi:hypothetical protein
MALLAAREREVVSCGEKGGGRFAPAPFGVVSSRSGRFVRVRLQELFTSRVVSLQSNNELRVPWSAMRHLLRGSLILIAVLAVAASASGAQKARVVLAASGPMETGVDYISLSTPEETQTELERIRAAGAKYVRIGVSWSNIAPAGKTQSDTFPYQEQPNTMPADFDPRDPNDPKYNWSALDNEVELATNAGLQPLLEIQSAPIWAEGTPSTRPDTPGGYKPNAAALGKFATAIATRYNGAEHPRVTYWSIWNEPNLRAFLSPQTVGRKAYSPALYRSMLNAAADAIHAVNRNNIVIAGETSPFGGGYGTKPLTFMEKVLCISEKKVKKNKTVRYVYKSSCKARAKFDAWAHHPYTEGAPTRRARIRGDVSLGDMGDMRAALNTAIRVKHVVSTKRVRLWVTEFSWDSKPPDPKGVPAKLEARWVAETMYRLWKSGTSLLTWYLIRDQPFEPGSYYQSGLYYISGDGSIESDRPKPALTAFRFPFVALRPTKSKTVVSFWGRTPNSKKARVVIERRSGRKWVRVKTLSANRYGIFKKNKVSVPAKATVFRARTVGSAASIPFSVITPKKSWSGCTFGTCPRRE